MRHTFKYVLPLIFVLSCKDIPDISNPGLDPATKPDPQFSFSIDVNDHSDVPRILFEHVHPGLASYWIWEFGDGMMTDSGPSVSHTYANPGVFTVKLSVFSPAGKDTSTARVPAKSRGSWISVVSSQDTLAPLQTLNFGLVPRDTVARMSYWVRNELGLETLTGTMTLGGDSSFTFHNSTQTKSLHVLPGEMEIYTIDFHPLQLSNTDLTASLTFATNAVNVLSGPVELRGHSPFPIVSLVPDSLRFEELPVGSAQTDSLQFSCAPASTNGSRIDTVFISDTTSFSLQTSLSFPVTIAPSGALSITVQFRPESVGIHTATIVFLHDGNIQKTGILTGSGKAQ